MKKKFTIAIAGNPNCGKTCLFNNLTGAHQKVANWPGVTVEQKTGTFSYIGKDFEVVDLPGTYSLSAYSIEEIVVEKFVCETPPDLIINIVDATNLERHLVLTAEMLEMGVPMIIALNMMDEAKDLGLNIDIEKLSKMLDIPVVPTVARRNKGTKELLKKINELTENPKVSSVKIDYGREIEKAISKLIPLLPDVNTKLSKHIRIVMMLSGRQALPDDLNCRNLCLAVKEIKAELEKVFADNLENVFDGRWFGFANGIARMCVTKSRQTKFNITEKIDDYLTHPILGLVIFAACMWLTFQLVFTIGNPLAGLMGNGVDVLRDFVSSIMPDNFFRSIIVDGIISGVGGVIVFLPNILLLFLAIGFLEDTGYMARAAFVTDKIMHTMGLHGKSFIPMIVGFGCTVPGIMATRSLDTKRDRIVTALITPFMSCSAKLPVYSLFITTFFAARYRTPVLFSIYFFGILVAIIMANILGFLFFGKEKSPLLMELPPYRMPTFRSVVTHMWMRAWMYLKKAGTLILIAAIVIWFLSNYPKVKTNEVSNNKIEKTQIENSYAGKIGKVIEPVFRPLGFDWKGSIALVTGFAAKEVVVSTLGVIYGVSDDNDKAKSLQAALQNDSVFGKSPLVAYTFMVFVLLYVPCLAVVAVFLKEFGWRWTIFLISYTTIVAWVFAFGVKIIGGLFV